MNSTSPRGSRTTSTRPALACQTLFQGHIAGLIAYGFLLVIWCAVVTYADLLPWPWWVPVAAAALYLVVALPLTPLAHRTLPRLPGRTAPPKA